jgi:hypothetical protein
MEKLPVVMRDIFGVLLSSAVPVFVLLSFYLLGSSFSNNKDEGSSKIVKRLKRLFGPFLFWSTLGMVVYIKRISLRNIVTHLFFGTVFDAPLYYLVILIYLTLFMWLIVRFGVKIQSVIMLVLVGFCVWLQYSGTNYNLFVSLPEKESVTLGRLAELYPYSAIGYFVGYRFNIRNCLDMREQIKILLYVPLLIVLFLSMLFYFHDRLDGFGYQGGCLLLFSVTFFMLFLLLPNGLIKQFLPRIVLSVSGISLGIFCSHYLINKVLRSWLGGSPVYDILVSIPFFYGLLLFLLSYFLCRGMKKYKDGILAKFVS